jgi:hypothetical protein
VLEDIEVIVDEVGDAESSTQWCLGPARPDEEQSVRMYARSRKESTML